MESKQPRGLISKTPQKNNLDKILVEKIKNSGFDVTIKDLSIYNVGICIKDFTDEIQLATLIYDKIVDCADIYFGIRANQLSTALTTSVVKQIMLDFPLLTVDEIEHCFERFVEQKTDWRNITKFELMQPILKFYNLKLKIASALEHEELEEQEKILSIEKQNLFYYECIEMYNQSLINEIWIGTIFHATILHKKFRSKFSDIEVDNLKKDAEIIYNKYQNEDENMFTFFAHTKERILANLVLDIAIKNKWTIKI